MGLRSFLQELKRRNVFRAAIGYAAVAWVVIQICTQTLPFFDTPAWVLRFIIIALPCGFPFAMVWAWMFEMTPQGIVRTEDVPPGQSVTRQTGRKLDFVIISILALAVALLVFDRFRQPKLHLNTTDPKKSLAVLPLVNSTGDAANEYFSDGMSEEFISSLSRLRELKVIGRTSSFQFKGKNEDSKTIGEKLGVHYLLEGSVRKSADRMRIAVALIKSADGANVWTETYDRELKDIFALQSEIAGAVAKQLKVALLANDGRVTELAPMATPSNQNVEAYHALLQGNFHFYDYRKAVGYYEEAIRLDPKYALAYAKMSLAARNLALADLTLSPEAREEVVGKARASVARALELDPTLADAHSSHGVILEYDFNFSGAEAALRRAVELAPQHPGATSNLGYLMALLGRFDEAIALARHAITLDPLRPGFYRNLARYLTALGFYDEAEAALNKFSQLRPPSPVVSEMAVVHILRDQPGTAVEAAKKMTHPVGRSYFLALGHFANGDRPEADAELNKFIEKNAHDSAYAIATIYALRKEPEKMFEWLERAWAAHDPGLIELLLDPFLRAYKDDPRFIAFAQKIGLIPKGDGRIAVTAGGLL